MDLVSSCKDKLTFFRIKELKDVLTQMGLAKQGKKQDLLDRILAVISDDQGAKLNGWAKKKALAKEAIAKIIDDTYRKMQVHGATDLASKGQNSSNSSGMQPKQEADKSFQPDMKIRCPCGSSLGTESMIECEDPRCHVWQHMACVIIPEKAMEGVYPEIPAQFYCEICRVNRADPFWVTLANPLYPVKLTPSSLTTEGGNPVQTVEKTFTLTKSDRDLLQKTECDLQAWCILLNDKVSFRMQWPQYADLHVNGVPVRTTNRPGTQLLGINGRDDGPAITTCSREGINKISLSCCDARVFCFGVRIVRRRSVQQVLSLIPKVANGERFEEALTRVCRCIGGSNSANNADSDSDLEVVADSVTVNLRCPMSGSRMKTAGRFKPCVHMGCFDLDTFVELNQRSRKWQCPICLKNYSLEHIIIDPYFNRITSMMWDCGEDVNEIDVKPDGSWRVKNETEHRDLARWHYPDGSLCVPAEVEMRPNPELMKQIKQEAGSDGHSPLKLGIKKNRNGIWEVSKREEMRPQSSGVKIDINAFQKIMHMSSSATGSYREDEDPSVNQDGGGNFEFSTNNGHELDSFSLNLDSTYGATNRGLPAAQPVDLDVIVLSDSEEDNVHMISTETIYETGPAQNNGINFSVPPPSVADSYLGDPGHNTSGSPCLLFNNQDDDFGMPLWSLPPCSQAGTSLQLFGTDTDVQETLGDERVTSAVQANEFGLGSDKVLGTSSEVPDSFGCHSKAELTGGLVDNPLAFADDDPSLQIFLPSWPARGATRPDLRENTGISTADRTEDWISLSLGGGGGTHCGSDTAASCLNSQHQLRSEGRMESPANTASLLMSINEDRSNKTQSNKRTSAGPFSHPRQPRSVRPRLYLSIESESE